MNQTIDSINPQEATWIKRQLESAEKFIEGFSPLAQESLTLAALDRAFAAWIASEPDVDIANSIINYVGVAFGQALVDGIGLQWVIATDGQHSELAVFGLPGRGDFLVYPQDFVAKRWERREINFLEHAYQRIEDDVRSVNRDWQGSYRS